MNEKAYSNSQAIPQPIVRKLRRLIRRVRMVVLLRGLCAVSASAAGMLLLIMAIDARVVIFQAWPRWLLSFSALAVTLAALWAMLIRPLARSFSLAGIARAIESRHPELHERISSAVELLTSKDAPELRGSQMLIEALAREATLDARAVTPRREVTLRSVRPFLIAAAATAAILAGLLAVQPAKTSRLLARAVAPHANIANVSATDLKITPATDVTIAQGQRLTVEVLVNNKAVRHAELRRVGAAGRESAEPLSAMPAGDDGLPRFGITLPPAWESFRYRIRAGDALSRYFAVTVVPLPAVKSMSVRYDYPAYAARQPRLQEAGDIQALCGTEVTITARTNKPLKEAQLYIDGQAVPESARPPATAGQEGVCSFALKLTEGLAGRWRLKLTDEHGFVNWSQEHGIQAVADSPPLARIVHPEGDQLVLSRDDRLPIAYRAEDDFGLTGLELAVSVDGRKRPPVPLDLSAAADGPTRLAGGNTLLELSKLDLLAARQVTIQLRATDNLPEDAGGPQHGLSDPLVIRLDSKAEPYTLQVVLAQELRIRELLEESLKLLQAARAISQPLSRQLQAPSADQAKLLERIDALRGALASAAGPLAELVQQSADGTYAALAEAAAAASGHARDAEDLAGQAKLANQPAERAEAVKAADFHVARAVDIIAEQLKRLEGLTRLVQRAQQLEDLARRQGELAEMKALMEQLGMLQAGQSPQSGQAPQPGQSGQPGQAGQPGQGSQNLASAHAQDPAQASGSQGDAAPPGPVMSAEDWQRAQAALAGKVGQVLSQDRQAMQAQAAVEQTRSRNLAAEARALAGLQSALADDTHRLGLIQQAHAQLPALAGEQATLARETGVLGLTALQSQALAASADIHAGRLQEALAKQSHVQADLAARLDRLRRLEASRQLQAGIVQLHNRQQQLARAAEALRKDLDAQRAAESARAAETQPATSRPAEASTAPATAPSTAATAPAYLPGTSPAEVAGRVAEMAKAQDEVAAGLVDLARQIGQAAPPCIAAFGKHDPAAAVRDARSALSSDPPGGWAEATASAAAKLAELKSAFDQTLAAEAEPAGPQATAEKLAAFADRHDKLRSRTAQTMKDLNELPKAHRQAQVARFQAEQADIARRAAELTDRFKAFSPQSDRADTQAALAAMNASQHVQAGTLKEASAAAEQAGKLLTELADRTQREVPYLTGRPAGDDADVRNTSPAVEGSTLQEPQQVLAELADSAQRKREHLAEDTAALAGRQSHLALQMKAFAADDAKAMSTDRQLELSEGTDRLAEGIQLIQDHASLLIPDSDARKQASAAGAEVASARKSQRQAMGLIGRWAPTPASQDQRGAAASLLAAAEALEKLGRTMAELAAQAGEDELSQAFEAADQAARTQRLNDAELAARLLDALSRQAAAAAAQMGLAPMSAEGMLQQLMQMMQASGSGRGVSMMMVDLSEAELKAMGITYSDWAKLPGKLRDEIIQAMEESPPEEYRELIRQYFQELARRGGKKWQQKK